MKSEIGRSYDSQCKSRDSWIIVSKKKSTPKSFVHDIRLLFPHYSMIRWCWDKELDMDLRIRSSWIIWGRFVLWKLAWRVYPLEQQLIRLEVEKMKSLMLRKFNIGSMKIEMITQSKSKVKMYNIEMYEYGLFKRAVYHNFSSSFGLYSEHDI